MHLGKSSGLQLYIRRLRIGIRFAMAHLRHAQEGKSERNRAVNKERPITRRATERTAQDRADDRGGEGGCVIISGEGAHLLRRAISRTTGSVLILTSATQAPPPMSAIKIITFWKLGISLVKKNRVNSAAPRPNQSESFLSADLLAQLSGRNCKNHQ